MSDRVRKDVEGSKGRYVLAREGHGVEVTFTTLSDQTSIADQTAMPDTLRGTGAGEAMVAHRVEDKRAAGFMIVPLCTFVDAQRRKHPDWADAFAV